MMHGNSNIKYNLDLFLLEAETPIAHSAYAALICKQILINKEAHWDASLNKELSM
jgi:hypothetical protein